MSTPDRTPRTKREAESPRTICQTRVVAYIRMSSDKQDASPQRQWEQIAYHATRNDYTIGETYSDLGIAGDDHSRPEFQRLLADAQAGKFDLILIDEPSRLSRTEPLQYIGEVVYPLAKARVAVESVSAGRLYWDDISGLIMSAVLIDRSSSEVKNMSRRVLDGMAKTARAAWWNSVPPFGYLMKVKRDRVNPNKIISRRLVPGNAKHVAAVQWMFREYAKGRAGLPRIVQKFISWGIRGRKRRGDKLAKPFTPQGIWGMLRNPAYVGDTVWNKHSKGKYSKLVDGKAQFQPCPGKNPPSDWIVMRDSHPALVKRSTFQAVQDRLNAKPKPAPRNYSKDRFKLSKLLVCGQCNSRMFGCCRLYKTGRVNRYRCGGYTEFGPSFCNCNSVMESSLISLISSAIQAALSPPNDGIPRSGNLVAIASKILREKLWKAMAVLEQGTPSQVRSVFGEIFDRIVLHFDQRVFKKLTLSSLCSGEIYLKLPGGSDSTMPMLRLSSST